MKTKAWAIKPRDENRIVVNQNNFGNYAIYPSEEAATAFCKSQNSNAGKILSDNGKWQAEYEFEVIEITISCKQNE